MAAGVGLELLSTASAAHLTDLMMGPPSQFGAQPMTRDLLGLSIGVGSSGSGASTGGLSALLNSFGGGGSGFDVAAAAAAAYGGGGAGSSQRESWEGAQDR